MPIKKIWKLKAGLTICPALWVLLQVVATLYITDRKRKYAFYSAELESGHKQTSSARSLYIQTLFKLTLYTPFISLPTTFKCWMIFIPSVRPLSWCSFFVLTLWCMCYAYSLSGTVKSLNSDMSFKFGQCPVHLFSLSCCRLSAGLFICEYCYTLFRSSWFR